MDLSLISKPNAKSPVWAFFGYKPDEKNKPQDETQAICRLCHKTILSKGGNTSNLASHLKTNHPASFSKLSSEKKRKLETESSVASASPTKGLSGKQPTIMASISNSTTYEKNSKRWSLLTRAVTKHLAGNMIPASTVDSKYFREMLRAFDPRFELPGRNYFNESAIPALYNEVRNSVQNELLSTQYYAVTTDMWSSTGMVPYLGLTVHYINDEWELKSRVLETLYFPENHTGENIANVLKETVHSWKLDPAKLVCITTDNGSNILSATKILNWPQLSCFGHNLNLAVNNAIKGDKRVSRMLGVCRTIVSTFSTSWIHRRNLANIQAELGLPQHSLVTDCATRWGSKYDMIKRVLEQEPAIRKELSSERKTSHLVPTWQDSQVMESVTSALEPVSEFTDILSAENYVSISAVKPLVSLLESELLDTSADKHELTKDIKNRIKSYMSGKYCEDRTVHLLSMSSFLDPRFKMKYLSDHEFSNVKREIVTEKCMHSKSTVNTNSENESAEPVVKRKKTIGSLFANKMSENSASHQGSIENEIAQYLSSETPDSEMDPVEWWKLNGKKFPSIAQFGRKYLCICATSVPSERLFSKSGHIVCPKRACLKPEKVNMLSFLATNL